MNIFTTENLCLSNLYYSFQDYLRDLEKEEEEQKKIQKVLLCSSFVGLYRALPPTSFVYCLIYLFSNVIGRIEKDRT